MLDKPADLRADLEVGIYGTHATDIAVPKLKMPEGGLRADVARALVRDELFLDGNARQNLATFCQTYLNDDIHELMDMSLDKNMIDKDEYPATAELESRCVHILADLWHSPAAADTIGCSTNGLERSQHARRTGPEVEVARAHESAAGQPFDKPNHRHRAQCRSAGINSRAISTSSCARFPLERLAAIGMTPEEVTQARRPQHHRRHADLRRDLYLPNTNRWPRSPKPSTDLRATKGLDIPMHVDAASGGFVAPFVEPDLVWDFDSLGCARSTHPAINLVWPRWASAGWCGARRNGPARGPDFLRELPRR